MLLAAAGAGFAGGAVAGPFSTQVFPKGTMQLSSIDFVGHNGVTISSFWGLCGYHEAAWSL